MFYDSSSIKFIKKAKLIYEIRSKDISYSAGLVDNTGKKKTHTHRECPTDSSNAWVFNLLFTKVSSIYENSSSYILIIYVLF